MTLLGEIVRDGQIVCSDTALNDIVLTRLEKAEDASLFSLCE